MTSVQSFLLDDDEQSVPLLLQLHSPRAPAERAKRTRPTDGWMDGWMKGIVVLTWPGFKVACVYVRVRMGVS